MLGDKLASAAANGDLLGKISGFDPFIIVKWFFITGLVMYAIFALVIVKQTGIMTESVESEANFAVRLFAWTHLLLAAFLIAVSILVL